MGEIKNLERQVPFPLVVNGITVATYIADWTYAEWQPTKGWVQVVHDQKGVKTQAYVLKKALMWACHGVRIRETR